MKKLLIIMIILFTITTCVSIACDPTPIPTATSVPPTLVNTESPKSTTEPRDATLVPKHKDKERGDSAPKNYINDLPNTGGGMPIFQRLLYVGMVAEFLTIMMLSGFIVLKRK
jgi:hypothetical protein